MFKTRIKTLKLTLYYSENVLNRNHTMKIRRKQIENETFYVCLTSFLHASLTSSNDSLSHNVSNKIGLILIDT